VAKLVGVLGAGLTRPVRCSRCSWCFADDVDDGASQSDLSQAHLDNAPVYIAPGSFWSRVLDPVVRWSTGAVIWGGMRL